MTLDYIFALSHIYLYNPMFIMRFPLLLSCFSLTLLPSALGKLAQITDTRTNITYQGLSGDGIETFLNIPYGQDTGGAGRFLPPRAFVPAHNTIFNATVAGAVCPQQLGDPLPGITGIAANVTDISEDCLNLRLTRPSSIGKDAKLPVMVFIYGGKPP
jgi:carboxylesterase type B